MKISTKKIKELVKESFSKDWNEQQRRIPNDKEVALAIEKVKSELLRLKDNFRKTKEQYKKAIEEVKNEEAWMLVDHEDAQILKKIKGSGWGEKVISDIVQDDF